MEWIEGILVVVTVWLSLAWLICRLKSVRTATRDFVWRTALTLVALTPAIFLCRAALSDWQWRLPVWPANVAQSPNEELTSAVRVTESFPASPTPRQAASSRVSPRTLNAEQPITSGAEISKAVPSPAPKIADLVRSTHTAWGWMQIITTVWLAGFLVHVIALSWSAWKVFRLRRSAQDVTDAAGLSLNQQCAQDVGLRCVPRLTTYASLATPVVVGIFRPQIVIPLALLRENQHDLRAVLLHECGHLRRRDLAYDLLLRLVMAVYWPHPLIYVLAREVRRLREEMCDNFVLARESAVNYADILLRVAVGQRLNGALLPGIGVISNPHHLERRVASILSPQRRVETSVSRKTSLFVSVAVSGLLAVGLLVRLTPVAAVHPESTIPAAGGQNPTDVAKPPVAPSANPDGDAPKETPQKAVIEAKTKPTEIGFRVVDSHGKPVVGAKVFPRGVSTLTGASFGNDEAIWKSAESDAEGRVRFALPAEIIRQANLLKGYGRLAGTLGSWLGSDSPETPNGLPKELLQLGIHKIYMRVDHSEHPVWLEYLELGPQPQVELADSYTILVRARRAGETELAQRIVPQLSGSHSIDWSEEAGVLTYRRVDLSSQQNQNRHSLRITHFPVEGSAWFSDVVDLKHIAGNPIELDVTLHPGIRVVGRLADDIPRPVKNGTIVGKVSPDSSNQERNSTWSVATKIAEDGTFVLESMPRNGSLQLIALCDGWSSRAPTQTEITKFQAQYDFPREKAGYAGAAHVHPQFIHVGDKEVADLVVSMSQTTACEITAVDAQNRPVAGVRVQFNPNHFFFDWGSTLLGSGHDDAAYLRHQLLTGDHALKSFEAFHAREYFANTDQQGKATVFDLPCAASDAPASHQQAEFFATHEKYVAQSPTMGGMSAFAGMPFLVAKLKPGKLTQVTVRMVPQALPDLIAKSELQNEVPESKPPTDGFELTGRVEDEEGHPLNDVKVLLGDYDDCFKIRTNDQGAFRHRFDQEIFAGSETPELPLRFVKAGFAPLFKIVGIAQAVNVQLGKDTWFEGIVRKPDGTPAANVPVRGFHQDLSVPVYGVTLKTETTTDAQGCYRLHVETGLYRFIVGDAANGVALLPKGELDSNAEPPTLPISFGDQLSLDIQLEPSVQFVADLIDSRTGKPISDAGLFVDNGPDDGVHVGRTNASGKVIYSALPVGKLRFRVSAENHLRCSAKEAIPTNNNSAAAYIPTWQGLTFDLRPGMNPVRIYLEPGVEVSGVVRDPHGEPVPNVTVYLAMLTSQTNSNHTDRYWHQTNDQGRFRFLLPTSGSQTYRLVGHDRYGKKERKWTSGISKPFAVEADRPVHDLEIRLTEPGVIRGRVVDRKGEPVASAFVRATTNDLLEEPNAYPSTTSKRDGNFELRDVRPGHYSLHGKSTSTDADARKLLPQVEVRPRETIQVGDVVIQVDERTDSEQK